MEYRTALCKNMFSPLFYPINIYKYGKAAVILKYTCGIYELCMSISNDINKKKYCYEATSEFEFSVGFFNKDKYFL